MEPTYEAGSSFAPAFLLLGRRRRAALSAYYGFARAADDIADDPALPPGEKETRLRLLREAVERVFAGTPAPGPLEAGLARAAADFPLKKEHFTLLLEGVAADLAGTRYATYRELEGYMNKVAGAPGCACLAISGYAAPGAEALARKLGCAVQLTNIIRDAAEDHAAGRVYIPAEDLARFNCRPSDLEGSNYGADFIELMRFEASRARGLYAEAAGLCDPSYKLRLLPALAMAGLYEGLLEKMAAGGFRLNGTRPRLSPAEKAAALFSALLKCLKL